MRIVGNKSCSSGADFQGKEEVLIECQSALYLLPIRPSTPTSTPTVTVMLVSAPTSENMPDVDVGVVSPSGRRSLVKRRREDNLGLTILMIKRAAGDV